MTRWQGIWRRGMDRLSIYLPVVLMGVLALASYWMLKNTPAPELPRGELPARHETDYFMRRFAVKTFDAEGRLKSEVAGAELRHYPDTDTVEINQVRIRSFDQKGRLTTAQAQHALSNGDGSEVQLLGQAHVVREADPPTSPQASPRLEFKGEFLHAFLNQEQVRSHLPVTLVRGQDHFSSDTLEYDNLARIALLKGHVKGQLVPKPATP